MRIRITPEAQQDLAAIADYIKAENPQAARRVSESIAESIAILGDFPELGRLMTDTTVRKQVTSRYGYLIYYEVDGMHEEVVILAIYHHARNVDYPNR